MNESMTLGALNSFEMLRQAVKQAFPDRRDIAALNFDGTRAQAWQAIARLLAIDEAQLARKLAPVFQVELAGSLEAADPAVLA